MISKAQGLLSAYMGPFDRGHIIALPFDPSELVVDTRSEVRSFYSLQGVLPFETVSLVSKELCDCLHLSAWKFCIIGVDFRTCTCGITVRCKIDFLFRVDTDEGSKDRSLRSGSLLNGTVFL